MSVPRPPQPSSPSVGIRMIAAVALPLLLLALFAAEVVAERRATATAARQLDASVSPLVDLVALRRALYMEQTQYQVVAAADAVEIDVAVLSGLLGLPVDVDPTAVRRDTDGALDTVPAPDRPFSVDDLEAARAAMFGPDGSTRDGDGVTELDHRVRGAVDARLADLAERAVEVGDIGLQQALLSLHDAVDGLGASAELVASLASQWFAPAGDTGSLVELAGASERFDRAMAALATSPIPSVAGAVAALGGIGDRFAAAVDTALAGGPSPLAGDMADLFGAGHDLGDGMRLYTALSDLTPVASHAVVDATASLAAGADGRARQATVLAVGAVVVAVAVAAWSGRTITRPLRRLRDHAHRVSDGDLSVEPLPVTGPPELALASSAFNVVVANLLLLERKAHALSECAFDDPALTAPLPGRLGQALQRSLLVLSGSIVEREELQTCLAHQATHDALTSVANRAAAIDALEGALARSRRTGALLAVAIVDLDDFKRANDTYGHGLGDVMLREVAQRIERAVRRGDLVARLGGDEFLVLAEDLDCAEDASDLIRRVLDAVAEPMIIDGHRFTLGASAGIALDRDHHDGPLDLLAQADLAVHRAKQRGTSAIELYDEDLQTQLLHRADVETALGRTLRADGDELELCYQPILDARSGRLTSVEALIRWRRPGHGLVAPDDFIPIAESSCLIVDVDRWVLHAATAQLAAWAAEPDLADVVLAVNVSGRHVMDPSFVDNVRSAVDGSGIAPERLVVEVTETVLVSDLARAAAQLDAVRSLGVRVAVDDFGTGYTSLAHLRALPVDEIKIDRSFVAQLPHDADGTLIQIVNDLARHLGVPTVAEGVESAVQARVLAEMGCDALQGYLFTRPLPAAALVAWAGAHVAAGPVR